MPSTFGLLVLLIVSTPQAVNPPLTVSHVVTGPDSHVTLTNTATQPVTAWSLATTTRAADGRTHREVETVDGYLSEATHGIPGSTERLEQLMPGQAREIQMDPLPVDATVEVAAVILDDGTAIGDAQIIRSIFDRRAAERDALQTVVDAFNDVLRTEHGTAALDTLRDRLTAIAQRSGAQPCRAAVEAVQTYRARGGSPEAIDESLRSYAAFVTRELALATKHARQRSA